MTTKEKPVGFSATALLQAQKDAPQELNDFSLWMLRSLSASDKDERVELQACHVMASVVRLNHADIKAGQRFSVMVSGLVHPELNHMYPDPVKTFVPAWTHTDAH